MKSETRYRIAITGPESTGKTELAEKLAEHYNTVMVPDYSREYLEKLERKYDYDDILHIAKTQLDNEVAAYKNANTYLFCDTDLIVNKIWCEDKFGKCHKWILKNLKRYPYDLYLLCNIDLPWEPDPLRENPDDRERIFELYLKELRERGLPFTLVAGQADQRLANAIAIVDYYFKQ